MGGLTVPKLGEGVVYVWNVPEMPMKTLKLGQSERGETLKAQEISSTISHHSDGPLPRRQAAQRWQEG